MMHTYIRTVKSAPALTPLAFSPVMGSRLYVKPLAGRSWIGSDFNFFKFKRKHFASRNQISLPNLISQITNFGLNVQHSPDWLSVQHTDSSLQLSHYHHISVGTHLKPHTDIPYHQKRINRPGVPLILRAHTYLIQRVQSLLFCQE